MWPFMALFFVLAFFYQERKQAMYALRIPFFNDVKNAAVSSGRNFSPLKYLIAALLTLALMRPVSFSSVYERPFSGRSIMMILDISGSMTEQDVAMGRGYITRMDAVQIVVSEFIEARHGDLIGITLFGTRGYLYVPLTYDLNSAKKMMGEVTVGLAGQRTAIGDGLAVGIKAMDAWTQKDRVIILLSDGAENAGRLTAARALEIAKEKKIKIHAIGLGRPTGFSDEGFDEALLRKIAKETGGRYFNASNMQGLQNIYNEIDKIEPALSTIKTLKVQKELFFYPLFCAVLLILYGLRRRKI